MSGSTADSEMGPQRRSVTDVLLRTADEQVERGHFGVAIVIAQAVVEAVVEWAFFMLFTANVPQSAEAMMQVLPDRTFQARATRTLWTDLTGDDIKHPRDDWREYCTHVE